MPLFFYDYWYFIFLAPALLITFWATARVKIAFAHASKLRPSSGMSGAEAAAKILYAHGLNHVQIEPTNGFLGDHYDPKHKVLRLSPDVFAGRSIAAVGVAAHEAGHAIQDQESYAPLALRNMIVPLASIGSNLSFGLLFLGFIMSRMNLVYAGIALFSVVVLFQIINLPVEFDASKRARRVLVDNGIVAGGEEHEVAKVLNAAAMTYVAATLTAILTLVYYLWRAGLLGGNRR